MSTALDRVNAAYAATRKAPRRAAARSSQLKTWGGEPPFWALDATRMTWQTSLPDRERIEHDFEGYVWGAGKADSIVFACFYTRLRHFAQARFRWENLSTGELSRKPSADIERLEKPWPTGTTGDLLAWMEVDATFAGNSYWTWTDDQGRFGKQAAGPSRRLTRMRPDWVWIVIGSKSNNPYALDAHIVAFIYDPRLSRLGGFGVTQPEMVILTPAEVGHYAPIPDPGGRFRGMSWITAALKEIASDRAAVEHKLSMFERGATLQTIVSLDKDVSVDEFDAFVDRFRASHEGVENAYGTLFIGGGADVNVTAQNLRQLDYRAVTDGGETRIAAVSGAHPAVVGLSQGLSGSALNSGNFRAAKRNMSDGTLQHLWEVASASLQNLVPPPRGHRLWIDRTAIPFMKEDAKDEADIQVAQVHAIRGLLEIGFHPNAAVQYVAANDLSKLLDEHSGLFSVQLWPPGTTTPPGATSTQDIPSPNGNGRVPSAQGA